MKRIIFIKPADSSFILTDQKILEKYYRVTPYLVKASADKLKYVRSLLSLSLFLARQVWKSDALTCWFGDFHAAIMVFFARLAGKPSLIFAGGQESVCYKELGKGVYLKKVRGAMVKYALRNCTVIMPNHASLIYHVNHFYSYDNPHIDGIDHYVGKIRGQYEVIPNGIDKSRIDRDTDIMKDPRMVLTVGTMYKKSDFLNKGFDLFIEAARRCSDLTFVLIGIPRPFLEWTENEWKVSEISNLTVIPSYCPSEVLREYFNKATVYLQVSITEGMPVSLGEAMLCECIPVGSNVNGIPDAIGDNGVIVHRREVDEVVAAIRKALSMGTGKQARWHTLESFSDQKREARIREVFEKQF